MPFSEEDVKTQIEHLFFKDCVVEKNRLDFAVSDKKGHALYWAESKKGNYDKWLMLAQLFLTIKPRIDKAELPPIFIGCFDAQDITFVEFHHAQDVFQTNDFNWNERPSAVSPKTAAKIKRILDGKEITFRWLEDKDAVKEFVKKIYFILLTTYCPIPASAVLYKSQKIILCRYLTAGAATFCRQSPFRPKC